MEPFTISTGVAGFLSVAIEISKILEEYISGVASAPGDAQLLVTELALLCQVLKQLVDFLRSEDVKGEAFDRTSVLCSVIALCQNQIEGLYKRVDKLRGPGSDRMSRALQRMKWPFEGKECSRIIEILQRCSQTFHFSLNVSNCALLSETSSSVLSALESQQKQLKQTLAVVPQLAGEISRTLAQIAEVREVVATLADSGMLIQSIFLDIREVQLRSKDEFTDKLLHWLSPLEPQKRHQEIRSKRLSETGHWLLAKKEFQAWHDDDGNSLNHVLWCPGIPGAGKTIISSLVIDYLAAELAEQKVGICCLYCDYRERNDQTPVNMIGGLLKQLVLATPSIPQDIVQLFEKNQRERTALELVDAEKLLLSTSRTFDRVYICVDAVDECGMGQRKDFLNALRRSLQFSVRLFITGRTNIQGDIDRYLSPQLTIPIVADKSDVRKYIISKIDDDNDPELMDERLKDEIVGAIETAHDGMFLLPALQIRTVLEQRRKSERRAVLKRLPTGLYAAYFDTMERIRAQPRSWTTEAVSVLMWTFMAERPLKIDELCHALSVKVGEAQLDPDNIPPGGSLLDCCLGLVVLDKETLTVRLVHYSLQEYLLTQQQTLFEAGHAQIASACLTYLYFENRSKAGTDTKLGERLERFPFLNYAACQWGHHARRQTDGALEALALNMLLSRPRLSWVVEVLYEHIRSLFLVATDVMQGPEKFSAMHVAAFFGAVKITKALLKSQDVDPRDHDSRTPLHWAARQGHQETVQTLLDAGADLQAKDDSEWSTLHWAAWKGHEGTVKLLLEKGAGTDGKEKHGWTALHWAALQGHEATVRVLLEKGANFSERDGGGWMPHQRAAKHGHEGTVRVFLDNGADVMARFNEGWTALDEASQEGHDSTVRLLLERGADIQTRDTQGRSPLHWASQEGHDTTVRLLVERGAPIDSKSNAGCTALHWAAQEGHDASVGVLLRAGANAEEPDGDGWTALHWATMLEFSSTVLTLLETGVYVNVKGKDGWTALDLSCLQGNEEIVQALLEKGAEVGANDDDGYTALHWAAVQGHDVVVRLLLEKGANIQAKDGTGATAMHLATMQAHETTVQLLLEKGADMEDGGRDLTVVGTANQLTHSGRLSVVLKTGGKVRAKDGGGYSTLHIAADEGHDTAVRMLLEKGANIEARDGFGWTAFHHACYGGYDAVAAVLLEKGAETGVRDRWGWTALGLAARQGHDVVVKLLLEQDSISQSLRDDEDNWVPLFWGTLNGHEAVVQLLLEKGMDPNSKDAGKGQTLLSRVAEKGDEKLVQLFIDNGADLDLKDDDGRTPLSRAVVNGHEAVARLLLDKGFDPNTQVGETETVLGLASENGHEAVAKLLLERGANVAAKQENGWTALHQAAAGGHDAVVQLLVKNGADITMKDNEDRTALREAAAGGYEAVVQSLVDIGADIAEIDKYGATALHWAALNGHEAVVQLLLEKGADPTAQTKGEWTASELAAHNGHEAVRRLFDLPSPDS